MLLCDNCPVKEIILSYSVVIRRAIVCNFHSSFGYFVGMNEENFYLDQEFIWIPVELSRRWITSVFSSLLAFLIMFSCAVDEDNHLLLLIVTIGSFNI
mmetsp:Transcript_26875/g.55593  ORF Transcript_26875/g.55593 Transcript_26875/m.55593 type:complete len:98 (-) Transcript_26875:58-351(-)